jgi:hypothetical protein
VADTSVIFNILAKDNASASLEKVGKAAMGMFTAFAAGKGIDFAKDAIESASDLNESMSKSQVVFGKSNATILQWSQNSAKAMGVSRQEAIESASTFGNFFGAMGIAQDKAAGMSTSIVKLAGDMASFNNADPAQVLEDLRSGLSGQVEPLRKYGVDLSDATLKQEAMREGMKISNGTLTASQKEQVAYALIMKQTTTAQGDFARTSSGLANQQRIMKAEFEDAKAKIGTGLLPIMLKFVGVLMKGIDFVQKNSGWITPLAIGLGVLAAGIYVVTAAQTAWNIAMALNPIGLIIIAVIALVAAFIYLWTHSEAFRKFFIGLWNDIWGFLKGIGHWFAHDFVDFFASAWHWIQDKSMAVVHWFEGIPGMLKSAFTGLFSILTAPYRAAFNFIADAWNSTIGQLSWSVPSWVPGIGGHSISVPHLPHFHSGGVVPGAPGSEMLAVLQAGETVISAGASGGRVIEVKFTGNVDSAFATAFMMLVRTGQIQIQTS